MSTNLVVRTGDSTPSVTQRSDSWPSSPSPTLSSLSPLSLTSSPDSSPTFQDTSPMTWRRLPIANEVIPKGLANCATFDPIRYKTEMCKNFQELGYCKFDNKCYYAHFAHELKVATYKHKNYKTQLCKPFHSDGYCDFGSRCAFIHSRPDVEKILIDLQAFALSCEPPMPHFTEDLDEEEEKSRTENRLKVFKNFENKQNSD